MMVLLLTLGFGLADHAPAVQAQCDLSYAQKILGYSPIAFWELDETGGATATDSSGNGLSGTETPTGTETPPPNVTDIPFFVIPLEDLQGGVGEADDTMATAPDDLTAPNGAPLLPENNSVQLFSYAKWLMSSGSQELLGILSGFGEHLGVSFTLTLTLGVVYALVYVVVYVLRILVWFFHRAREILDLILQVAQVIGGLFGQLGKALGSLLGL